MRALNRTPEEKRQIKTVSGHLWQQSNKKKCRAASDKWRNKVKSTDHYKRRQRSQNLMKQYDITIEQWEEMFVAQGSVCAACGSTDPRHVLGWQTDHCHTTNRVRGVLCGGCNRALGHMRENAVAIVALANYIRRFQCGAGS